MTRIMTVRGNGCRSPEGSWRRYPIRLPGRRRPADLRLALPSDGVAPRPCPSRAGRRPCGRRLRPLDGRPGVMLVTSGPGATNAITALTDALMDSIPVICITGQVPTHLIGSDAFQECDTVGITRHCTKHKLSCPLDRDLPRVLHEAFYVAQHGRPGPVVIDIRRMCNLPVANISGRRTSSIRPIIHASRAIPRRSKKR